ncbi:MAG: DUF5320 domain-containing protein [Bacteroidales bacterium]|jgi:hypothetical protein|nr:DUF5320 domain-containing protein [Bacteroidales bacterium]MCK9449315.1 DUF5320 domain-containing protein [Bacteroidales bacterium]MDD3701810.1 DUF5320 domain-containing protein [Bacteroidales bacterium]MDY0369744.1 DUF5320 domain-containing protein [Bacteroidales bacterium]
MPRLDGTGPEGKGPQTGRGMGRCANPDRDQMLQTLGRGRGRRMRAEGGPGMGRRLRYQQRRDW